MTAQELWVIALGEVRSDVVLEEGGLMGAWGRYWITLENITQESGCHMAGVINYISSSAGDLLCKTEQYFF